MQTSDRTSQNYSPGNTCNSGAEHREASGNLPMTTGSTQKGVAQVRPLLCPISPGTMQSKAVRQSHPVTPNIDDRDSLFSDLSAPLTDKHREKLSRLEELYASHDSANGSLKDIPHFRDEDLLSSRWSSAVQLQQQCPAKLTGWSPALSDMKRRGNSLSPRRTPDDDDGYSVYSDWDSYHLAGDRTRTKPRMTEADRRRDSTHEAFNRLSCVISCAPVAMSPEVPTRSDWDQESFWADLLKNGGGGSVEQKYDPACPTEISDLCAAFQMAEARTSVLLAGGIDVRNTRLQGSDTTALPPREEVKDTRRNSWGWGPVQPDTRNNRTGRAEEEKTNPRSRSDRRRRTHSHSRSRHTSPRQSFHSRRISRGGDRKTHHSSERHRTFSEGERTSKSHLENKSPKDNSEGATIERQNNIMLSEKELLRIVRLVHSGQFEPAMQQTLVQIIPEVIGRHPTQSSVSIEEVSQDTRDIVWQLTVLSPASSFPQILSSLPFLRKLFFQFKLPDTSSSVQDGLRPSSQHRPSTLSPERRRPEQEGGSSPQRRFHRKRKREPTPDLHPRHKFRRRSSTDRPDRRRSESRRSGSHGRSTPLRPSTIRRPLVTPREWMGHRRCSVLGSKYAFARHPQTVHRRYQLRNRTSAVHPREMITRSRNVGRLPRRTSPSERPRPEDRDSDREGHRGSPRARNLASYRRGAMPPLRPKTSKIEAEQNPQNVSSGRTSKPLAEAKTALDSTKDRDSSEISTSKTDVSKDGNIAKAPQSSIKTTGNLRDNPTKPSDSNLKKPSPDDLTTLKTKTKALPKPPKLLSCRPTVPIPRSKITPLLTFNRGRKFPGIEISRPAPLPRPPLLPSPHPSPPFPYKLPIFPISSFSNYSPLRQPTRWPRYDGDMMARWKLPSPPQMLRPSGNHVRSGVRPFL